MRKGHTALCRATGPYRALYMTLLCCRSGNPTQSIGKAQQQQQQQQQRHQQQRHQQAMFVEFLGNPGAFLGCVGDVLGHVGASWVILGHLSAILVLS